MILSETQVSSESLPGSRLRLTIELSADDVEAGFAQALKNLSQKIKVPGFRRGKVPAALIEAQISSEALGQEAANVLASGLLPKALANFENKILELPRLETPDLQRGQAGRLRATVTVLPEVVLPELNQLAIEEPHTEITENDIATEIEARLERLAEVQPVEREVRQGDLVIGDLKLSAGETVVELTAQELGVEPEVDGELKDLLALLLGTKIGESISAMLQLPKDSEYEELAGQEVQAELKIQGIKEKVIPDLTDEVATLLNSDQEITVEAFRNSISQKLIEDATARDKTELRQRAMAAVVEKVEMEIPDLLIDHEIKQRMETMDQRLKGSGLSMKTLLESSGRSEQAYAAALRPDVEQGLKAELTLEAVAEKLAEQPSQEFIEAEIRRTTADSEETAEEWLKDEKAVNYFRLNLLKQQALDRLVEEVGRK
ncbi:MAG: trigger factor [Candidatus Dormibacteraceae bacterium]